MFWLRNKKNNFQLRTLGRVRRTWSLSDMVVFCPVLAAALANTLSGTGGEGGRGL